MTHHSQSQEKNIFPDSRLPRWLRGPIGSGRGELPIDSVEEDGTALDTAKGKPTYKQQGIKRVRRRIAEVEELHEWIEKKAEKSEEKTDKYLETLANTLNDMVE